MRTNKNTLYVGQSVNIEKRLQEHRAGRGSKYLRAFGGFELAYKEECLSLGQALRREYEIKRWTKKKKEDLISGKI